jgi:hypothetical protein
MTTTKTLTAKDADRRSNYRLYRDCGHNYLADHAETSSAAALTTTTQTPGGTLARESTA